MEAIAAALNERLLTAAPRLRQISEREAAYKPLPHRWSKKEILGHLIDSASNNHQRFVRGQLDPDPSFPGYEQEGWARCQRYADADWMLLIDLWLAYNRHLAWVIGNVPTAKRATPFRVGSEKPMTLAELADDYIRHMDHHLAQLWRVDS